jgi:hypothetical protein
MLLRHQEEEWTPGRITQLCVTSQKEIIKTIVITLLSSVSCVLQWKHTQKFLVPGHTYTPCDVLTSTRLRNY